MRVMIIATRACPYRPNLEHELKDLGIPYTLLFVDDDPELALRYCIRHSPNLIVNEEVVFRDMPTEGELRTYFEQRGAKSE